MAQLRNSRGHFSAINAEPRSSVASYFTKQTADFCYRALAPYLNCTERSGRLRYSAVAGTTSRGTHCVRFHRDDSTLCDVVAAFVEDAAKCGEPTIVLATAPHWRGIRERLSRVAFEQARFVDANDVLREIVTESHVDTQRFIALLEAAKEGLTAPLRIFGEVVDLLIARGALAAALEIEHVGHRLAHDTGTTILCGYDLRHLGHEMVLLADQATDAIRLLKGQDSSTGSSMAAFIANAKDDGRCIAAGFDAVIPKPCLTATLLADVRALCERPR